MLKKGSPLILLISIFLQYFVSRACGLSWLPFSAVTCHTTAKLNNAYHQTGHLQIYGRISALHITLLLWIPFIVAMHSQWAVPDHLPHVLFVAFPLELRNSSDNTMDQEGCQNPTIQGLK